MTAERVRAEEIDEKLDAAQARLRDVQAAFDAASARRLRDNHWGWALAAVVFSPLAFVVQVVTLWLVWAWTLTPLLGPARWRVVVGFVVVCGVLQVYGHVSAPDRLRLTSRESTVRSGACVAAYALWLASLWAVLAVMGAGR